jgi:hypothetical protein
MADLIAKAITFNNNLAALGRLLREAEEAKDPAERAACIKNAMSILDILPEQLENIRRAARFVAKEEERIEKEA